MKRLRVLLILAALLSAACAAGRPSAPAATLQAPTPGVDTYATEQAAAPTRPGPTPRPLQGHELAVDQRMLQSSLLWDSLTAEAVITTNGQTQHVQVWIDQPGRFRLEVRPQSGDMQLTVSDGQKVRLITGELVDASPDLGQPFVPPAGPSDTVTLHPLGMSLGLPLIADVLFPVGLAQRSGHFLVTGQDTVAGRSATIIDWSYVAGTVNDRLWVDNETGVVLRQQTFGKAGANLPETEVTLQMIQFNPPLEDALFDVNQAVE